MTTALFRPPQSRPPQSRPPQSRPSRSLPILAAGLLCLVLGLSAEAEVPAPPPAASSSSSDEGAETPTATVEDLPKQHRRWLEEVTPLINEAEREVFISLSKDYQRDAFIQRFWRARDPFPETSRNELKERWEANLEIARDLYQDLEDPRAQMMLLNGEPRDKQEVRCGEIVKPLEIWSYEGTPFIRGAFTLVFYRRAAGRDQPYFLWYPTEGLYPLISASVIRTPSDQVALATISEQCPRGGLVVEDLTRALDWKDLTSRVDVIPDPGEEWLRTFVAYSTDLPEDAETFEAQVELSFPGRYQSRTLVQGLVSVDREVAALSDLEGHPSYNFVLDGEILRKDELFEHFRYRFNLTPGQAQGGLLPLAFERLLRPGAYRLELRVEDLNRNAFFRRSFPLEVPRVSRAPKPPAAPAEPQVASNEDRLRFSTRLLQEANSDLPLGDHSLKLLAPQSALVTGRLRVEALAQGEGIARVQFELNGKRVFSKSRSPYSVELNLGDTPRIHRVRAIAEDDDGRALASDEVQVNAGPHRFAIRLIEPQAGKTYRQSVRARAVVDLPEGDRLDRVEIYLNDTLVATLFQPPFVQPVVIPEDEPLSFVRAKAYLEDGGSAEDAVFVNAPDFVDEVKVQFVELYTTMLNRRGRPVEDLEPEEVVVRENGEVQDVTRFERVTDVPIHAGILLDVSNSMTQRLDKAVEGSLRFFETVLTPKDRAAVITFNETPRLAVRFTSSLEVLAGGLAGLTAEGETALHDSLIYSLYYFSGISGKRAIVLLSDGEDVRSRFTFDDVIDYARRTGVAIYAVGINLSGGKQEIRMKLQRLASETGGSSFFINAEYELAKVYESIQEELRSQYVISYQSGNEGDEFREVEVEVLRPGVTAKTISGYYP